MKKSFLHSLSLIFLCSVLPQAFFGLDYLYGADTEEPQVLEEPIKDQDLDTTVGGALSETENEDFENFDDNTNVVIVGGEHKKENVAENSEVVEIVVLRDGNDQKVEKNDESLLGNSKFGDNDDLSQPSIYEDFEQNDGSKNNLSNKGVENFNEDNSNLLEMTDGSEDESILNIYLTDNEVDFNKNNKQDDALIVSGDNATEKKENNGKNINLAYEMPSPISSLKPEEQDDAFNTLNNPVIEKEEIPVFTLGKQNNGALSQSDNGDDSSDNSATDNEETEEESGSSPFKSITPPAKTPNTPPTVLKPEDANELLKNEVLNQQPIKEKKAEFTGVPSSPAPQSRKLSIGEFSDIELNSGSENINPKKQAKGFRKESTNSLSSSTSPAKTPNTPPTVLKPEDANELLKDLGENTGTFMGSIRAFVARNQSVFKVLGIATTSAIITGFAVKLYNEKYVKNEKYNHKKRAMDPKIAAIIAFASMGSASSLYYYFA